MANCGKKLWLGNQEAFSGAFHVVETPVVQLGHTGSNGSGVRADVAYTLEATNSCNQAICVNARQDPCFSYERSPSLTANDYGHCLYKNDAVRRLIPKECERLQGFEDDYTNISGASDSARYKAIGNSWAVPKFAWLGQRIDLMEKGLFQ